MTTITKERLQWLADISGRDDIDDIDGSEIRELALIALASLDAEPAGYHVIKENGKVGCSVATLEEAEKTRDFWNKRWTIRPYFHSAPPVQETGVYNDVLNIIGLLENNEWAEHCTSTVLGSLLESEITRLVGKEQSAPVVLTDEQREQLRQMDDEIVAELESEEIACRAAMLQANQRDLSQPVDPQVADYEKTMLQAGNSPVIPDGWISCSERMPEDEQEVIVHNKLGYRYVSYFDEHSGLFFDMRGGNQMNCIEHILVTHWMPLPEPPLE
ncbi:TPA: DUF551 domain-containing protein [Salmonella enterica subsp. diarizonae serovar 61:r:-]